MSKKQTIMTKQNNLSQSGIVPEGVNSTAFLNEFFEVMTRNGYGSLPKRQIELLILQLFLKHTPTWKDARPSDFELARRFKTSAQHIRRLSNDLNFRDDSKDEAWCRERLKEQLEKAEVKKDHSWVQVQIDDGLVREYAVAQVRAAFGIVDTSFNTAIIRLTPAKFAGLAFSLLDDAEMTKLLGTLEAEELKDAQDERNPKGPIRLFLDAFAKKAGETAGEMTVELGFAALTGGASVAITSIKKWFQGNG